MKNIKLIVNYFIEISNISKGFDYFDYNTAFCSGYIKYSNYCGSSYVDFLKQTLWLAWVSPTFKTTIKVNTNSPQIDYKKKKYFNLSEQTKKEITFFYQFAEKSTQELVSLQLIFSSGFEKRSLKKVPFGIWIPENYRICKATKLSFPFWGLLSLMKRNHLLVKLKPSVVRGNRDILVCSNFAYPF